MNNLLYNVKKNYRQSRVLAVFMSLLVLLVLTPAVEYTGQPGVEVSGAITSDTTWLAVNSPYIVTGNIVVNAGSTLTIEPGVTVKFESGKALRVNGELIAQGSESKSILFTSNQASSAPGDWVGISFTETSVGATYDGEGNYISGSVMQYCTVEYGGNYDTDMAAIMIISSSPLIDRCNIHSSAGGGIAINGGAPRLVANSISGNARERGGGIFIQSGEAVGEAVIIGNEIFNNTSSEGGGVFIASDTVIFRENTVRDNESSGSGGGIYNYYGNISGNTISGNSAGDVGGGIYNGHGDINGNTIIGNSARYSGGGIYYYYSGSYGGDISGNTISGNSAGEAGGGIYSRYLSSYIDSYGGDISGNTITGNSAEGNGGGIYSYYSDSYGGDISGNTITGNSAGEAGGGIFTEGYTWYYSMSFLNNVISDNSGETGGGLYIGIHSNLSALVLYNSIFNNLGSGIIVEGYSPATFPATLNYNNIYGNENYDIEYRGSAIFSSIDATNNWWGTIDEAAIEEAIYDWNDDATLGQVIYQPIATAPICDFILAISSSSGGTVTTPGEGIFNYEEETEVDLIASPYNGYLFTGWTGDVGAITDTSAASTTIYMDANYSVTANFERIPPDMYELTINSTGGGSVITPGEGIFSYENGEIVSLQAQANEGYEFTGWTGDAVANSGVLSTTLIITANMSVTANFIEIPESYKVAFVTQPGGAVAGAGFSQPPVVEIQDQYGNLVESNAHVTLSIKPGTGTPGAVISGATVAAVDGVAAFVDASINFSWDDYVLIASSDNLVSAESEPFNVAAPDALVAYNFSLSAGWNLISLPLIPVDSSIGAVLEDAMDSLISVWNYDTATGTWKAYDPSAPEFMNDLHTMVDGKGYWVNMSSSSTITFRGSVMPSGGTTLPPSYSFAEGWNMVGFKSIEPLVLEGYLDGTDYRLPIYWYGGNIYYSLTENYHYFYPGLGYWVFFNSSGIVTP